jgi:hypothetical protein
MEIARVLIFKMLLSLLDWELGIFFLTDEKFFADRIT